MSTTVQKISEILFDIIEQIKKGDQKKVSVEELLESMGNRSFGPMLLIPALLAAFPPIGAIPGVSILMGSWIILIALQLFFFQKYLWVPEKIKGKSFERKSFEKKIKKLVPYIKKLEWLFKPRWYFFSEPPFTQILAFECIILAAIMFPLALIPFGVTIPAIALIFLSAGLTTKDGIMILLGNILCPISVWLLWEYLIKSFG